MNIEIKRNSKYIELIITAENVNYSSGLLDESECIEMAKKLIYAAECLMPNSDIENNLCIEREKLG